MKKLIATLLIVCGVITATTFGSQARPEANIKQISLTTARAEYEASYSVRSEQMILTLDMECFRGRGYATNVRDNTRVVNTAYLADLNQTNRAKGPINIRGSHHCSLTIVVNGQTLIM